MPENSPDEIQQAPLEGENREGETSFNTGDPKTAEFWEKYWDRASTRIGVGRAMGEAWAQQDDDEQGASYPQSIAFLQALYKRSEVT